MVIVPLAVVGRAALLTQGVLLAEHVHALQRAALTLAIASVAAVVGFEVTTRPTDTAIAKLTASLTAIRWSPLWRLAVVETERSPPCVVLVEIAIVSIFRAAVDTPPSHAELIARRARAVVSFAFGSSAGVRAGKRTAPEAVVGLAEVATCYAVFDPAEREASFDVVARVSAVTCRQCSTADST